MSKIINDVHDLRQTPFLSILIHVKNAEENIEEFIRSVIQQSYNNYELLILNDQSKDRTEDIVKVYCEKNSNIKLIQGKKKPELWMEKAWAFNQLTENASGQVLLLLDENVRLEEYALNAMLYKLQSKKADALSVYPTKLLFTFKDFLIAPLYNWILLSFKSLKKVSYIDRIESNQVLLINRSFLEKSGGFDSLKFCRNVVHEIAYELSKNNYKVFNVLGYNSIYSIPLRNFDNLFSGLSNSLRSVFNGNYSRMLQLLFWVVIIYLLPVILSFVDYRFIIPVLAIILNRILISFVSNQSPYTGILHPVQMLILVFAAISAKSQGNAKD